MDRLKLCVFVTGGAGIGKTTVVEAFLEQAAQVPGMRVTRGQGWSITAQVNHISGLGWGLTAVPVIWRRSWSEGSELSRLEERDAKLHSIICVRGQGKLRLVLLTTSPPPRSRKSQENTVPALELPDCLIPAVAVRLHRPLVTGNTEHFQAIQKTVAI